MQKSNVEGTRNLLEACLRKDVQRFVYLSSATTFGKIKNGDEINVESQNAITGETRSVKGKAHLIQGIHPGTISMSHHYGFWVHPYAKDGGPTPNTIFFTGEGYTTCTADQSFQVAVKVTKA